MRLIRTAATVSCLSIGLLGCAEYRWHRPGVTQAEFNRDSYACQMEVARAFPAAYVQQELTAGYTTQSTTNCTSGGAAYSYGGTGYVTGTSNTSCMTTPGTYVAPITYSHDANEVKREQAAKSCMYAKGYTRVRVK